MLPRLYAILDAEMLGRRELGVTETALELVGAGVRLLQFRDKRGDRDLTLRDALRVSTALAGSGCRLILNDCVELLGPSGFDGVHVGQGDLSATETRELIGPRKVLGVSTHTEEQLRIAGSGPADYVAIGPVFRTSTKMDAEPVVGIAGMRAARRHTNKPLVAIGGITALNAGQVLDAGADTVAVISALYRPGRSVEQNARELLCCCS